MNLLEALTAKMQTENEMTIVYRAIESALQPWRAGKIVAYISSWEGWERTIIFEVDKFPYMSFKFEFDTNFIVRSDYRQFYRNIAEAAFKFYRYRPALPVDDHIILGEE